MYRILKKRQLTPVTALYVIDAPLVDAPPVRGSS